MPKSVVIDAGQLSASFPIAALNSGLVVLSQTAVITANVETYAGVVVTQGGAEVSLLLLNANGPRADLELRHAAPVVEGVDGDGHLHAQHRHHGRIGRNPGEH